MGVEKNTEVLKDLNNLKKTIGVGDIDDYGNMYFGDQLARYYYTLNIIYGHLDAKVILDIGNYPCHLQKILLDKGLQVDGVDIRPERIPDRLRDCRERTYVWDIENEKANDNLTQKYDAILLLEVIEHLHVNPLNLLSNLSLIMKENGTLLLSTPNLFSMKNRINFVLGKQTFEHPFSVFEKLERHGSRGHQRVYSKRELTDMLEVYGFEIQNIWGMDYKTPLLPINKYKSELPEDFDFQYFKSFWLEKRSILGRLRRTAEIKLNAIAPGFSDHLFILAKKKRDFDQDLFFRKIAEADPWMDMSIYDLKA